MIKAVRAALVLGLALLAAAPAVAQERTDFGPFYVLASEPDRIYLDGALDLGSMQAFFDEAANNSSLRTLVLNSTSGVLVDALVLSTFVRDMALNTIVPAGGSCGGPCFFVFMAGIERTVDGTLSVKYGTDLPSLDYMSAAELRTKLQQFLILYGADDQLVRLFSDLQPAQSHVFTEEELASYGLARSVNEGAAQAAVGGLLGSPPTNQLAVADHELDPPLDGVLLIRNPQGEVANEGAITRWYMSEDEAHSAIAATVNTLDQTLISRTVFMAWATDDNQAFGGMVGVTIGSNNKSIARITALSVGNENGQQRSIFFVELPVTPPIYAGYAMTNRLLIVPSIYADVTTRDYADYDRFVLQFEYEDGTIGTLVFAMSDAARAAFDEALAAWAVE